MELRVEYLGGSGFLVSLADAGFLFDCSEKGNDPRMLPEPETLSSFSRLYFFATSTREDHFSPEALSRCVEKAQAFFPAEIPESYEGRRLSVGESAEADGVLVTAYPSTDEGISFMVETEGICLFHAGTLNLWHWRDISSIAEIEEADRSFNECLKTIPRDKIDLAFFPVDPRQGSMYDAGAGEFVMSIRPKILIPMQFQGRADAARYFSVTNETNRTKIPVLEAPGNSVVFTFGRPEEAKPQEDEAQEDKSQETEEIQEQLSEQTEGTEELPKNPSEEPSEEISSEHTPEEAHSPEKTEASDPEASYE